MGIKGMQGVSAHIEYLRKNPETIELVNCKFWKDTICYNTISTKYGECCWSKRRCMYSIPIPKGSKKRQSIKKSNKVIAKQTIEYTRLNRHTVDDIIGKYFLDDLEKEIKIDNKLYKIKSSYNKEKDILQLCIFYKNGNHKFNIKYGIKLKDIIRIKGNEVIFTVKIDTIIKKVGTINKKLAELIRENNINDITRKSIVNNEEDVIKSRDSLIKYTSYIITRELLKLYK